MNTAEQLKRNLFELCGYNTGQNILAACSGGADSVALVYALHQCGIPFSVAHVNYNLRGEESIGDEKFVSDLCAYLQVPLYIKQTSKAELDTVSQNLQNAARIIRYEFFQNIAEGEQISFIATAHHSDDQLETVLMNFLRGSGIKGLSGMKFQDGKLIRPLLNSSSADLRNYLQEKKVSWRDDSSNNTDDYLRNRIRRHLLPALNACDERNGEGWRNTIDNLLDSDKLLESLAAHYAVHVVSIQADGIHFNKAALLNSPEPRLLFNHLLRAQEFEKYFNDREFENLLNIQSGKQFHSNGKALHVDREEFVLIPTEDLHPEPFILQPDCVLGNGWSCTQVIGADPRDFQKYEALISINATSGDLIVRVWEIGDKFIPLGFRGTKKISDVLNEIEVPSHLRKNHPVVVCNNEIVWVPGYRIAEKFKVTEENTSALHIKWKN
jgi:tRNA(Ile)-lysidine synthase